MTAPLQWVFKEKDVVTAAFVHLEDAFILAINGYDFHTYVGSIWYGHCKVWDFVVDGTPPLSKLKTMIETCLERKRAFLKGVK